MSYAFIGICIIGALCCIAFKLIDKNFWGSIAQYIASFASLAIAVLSYSDNSLSDGQYFLFLFLALLFFLAGNVFSGIIDIAPAYRKKLIPMSMYGFMFGFILLITAMTISMGYSYVPLIVSICLSVVVPVLLFLFKFKSSLFLDIMITVYSFLVIYTFSTSISFYVITQSVGALLAMLGAMLLLLSKTCSLMINFKDTKIRNALFISETSYYYAGLILLSLSVLFVY